jgi:MATE family multidrug resistance protein
MLPAEAVLRLLHQPAAVVPRAAGFARAAAPGIPPLMVYIALRLGLQAMKRLRPVVITIVVANLVNAGLNVVFVFGRLGFPAMGSVGASLSSTVGRWVMALLLLALGWRHLHPYLRPWRRSSLEPAPLVAMLRLGLPIAGQMMIEFGAFSTVAVLAGWFGSDAMAGHQIAINLASLMFMVPLGIGSSAAVLVGHAIGEGDVPHARRVAGAALACGVSFMAVSAVLLVTMPRLFASAYSSAPSVVAVAAALIPIAGVFQVFDGLQVVSAGILRGIGDTRAPMLINVCAFWLVGMPVSLWLGFRAGGGVVGLWWGFVAGLAAVAVLLIARVRVRMGRAIERVQVERAS